MAIAFLFPGMSTLSQSYYTIDRTTDVAAMLPAVTGITVALVKRDYKGLGQMALSGVSAMTANYILEASIRKQRPDGTCNRAFPSTHSTAAFAGATFLARRYGWAYGVPAYAVSAYVAWGRVYAKKHDVWDVLAGAAIGAGCSLIFTRQLLKRMDLAVSPAIGIDGGMGVYAQWKF